MRKYFSFPAILITLISRPALAQEDIDVGRTWVFAVGVEQYRSPELGATLFCGDDADLIARTFQVVAKVPDSCMRRWVGSAEKPILSETVRADLVKFLALPRASDTVVFFFSGHGAPDEKGNLFLATSDYEFADPESTSLSAGWLRNVLADCRARTKIVLLNACFSGAFDKRLPKKVDPESLIDVVRTAPNTFVISSSSQDRTSFEIPEFKAGLFTYWLAAGLRGRANAKVDGYIDGNELFVYVRQGMEESCRKLNIPPQDPVYTVQQARDVPRVMKLVNPERPSMIVPASRFPLARGTEAAFLDVLEHPAAAALMPSGMKIARSKLVLSQVPPNSSEAQRARAIIDQVDAQILKGEARFDPVADLQEP